MNRLFLAFLIVAVSAGVALAEWQRYKQGKDIVASYNIATFAPFRDKPSVWVRWHYVTPRNGLGGKKLQFTADCSAHKLFEIAANPYDPGGNFLAAQKHYDSPKEYPVTPGSLNEATYKLLCR